MKNQTKQPMHDIDRIEELSAEDATMSEYQASNKAKEMVKPNKIKSDEQILRLYQKLVGEEPSIPTAVSQQPPINNPKTNKQIKSSQKLSQPPKLKQISPEKLQSPKKEEQKKMKASNGKRQIEQYEEPEEDINEIIKQTYVPISTKQRTPSIRELRDQEDQPKSQIQIPPRSGLLSKGGDKNKSDKNRTNYSAEYQEGKPFGAKTPLQPSKKTVSQDKALQSDNTSLKGSQKIQKKTAENFKNKLSQHIVKDKQQLPKQKGRIPPKAQPDRLVEQKVSQCLSQRLKEQLMELNYQQTVLQAELRKIHMDNKERNSNIYKTQNIKNTVRSVKQLTSQEVLVLDDEEPEEPCKPIASKKLKFLNEDKQYVDDIKLQIRQLNYLLKKKDDALKNAEQRVKSNPLHYFLYEWKQQPKEDEEPSKFEQQKVSDLKKLQKQLAEQGLTLQQFVKGKQNNLARMIVKNMSKQEQDTNDNVEYSSYKELMRDRKNKTWMRNQRLNFDGGKPMKESDVIQQPIVEKPDPQKIQTIQLEGEGKLKVNTHLKNLLFN